MSVTPPFSPSHSPDFRREEPFALCGRPSPALSSLSTEDGSDVRSEGSSRSPLSLGRSVIDPVQAAGKKIVNFIARKLRASKALQDFRKRLQERKAEIFSGKSTFSVKKIPFKQLDEADSLVAEWQGQIEELQKIKTLTEEDREKLRRAGVILESIRLEYIDIRKLVSPRHKGKRIDPVSIYVAVDSTGKIQAMAQVTRAYKWGLSTLHLDYRIDYLVTSPENLRLSIQPSCTSGSATAIIEEIAFACMRHTAKREISLEATERAIPFYERLGFHCTDREERQFSLSSPHNLIKFLGTFGGIALAAE